MSYEKITESTAPSRHDENASPISSVYDLLSEVEVMAINRSYTKNALTMMQKRYLQPKEDGTQETPVEMLFRIARATAEVERDYGASEHEINMHTRTFLDVLVRKEFTPAGRTVTNAGATTALVANCIVLGIEDSMDSIFQTLKDAAELQQTGSGLGFDFSNLRPAMEPTKRTQGVASGPVEFLKIYDTAFGIIKQQSRKGANMGMMSIDHPDVIDFIQAKKREGEIRNFNISVQLTDKFMEAATQHPDEQWYCEWDGEKRKPHKIERAPDGTVINAEDLDITARELFDMIVEFAWENGEPGIFFIDEVNRVSNPLPGLGRITCTNPCGEQPLHPNDNCNLGSINLAAFVRGEKVDWDRLREVTRASIRLQDNIIDLFDFPVDTITELAKKNRRIGLGVMGFADMLYQLGIPYNSEAGVEMAERVMRTINDEAHIASRRLAHEKGEFPNINLSVYGEGFGEKHVPMRNSALTTIAPTGSIAMMYDCSSGIEPNFALTFIKQDKDGEKYMYLNTYFKEALEDLGLSEEKMQEVEQELKEKGSVQDIDGVPEDVKQIFVVSMDIAPEDHMKMQAAFQRHTDNSISKTINYPNSATKEDIARGYISAWKLGCLSCTVYRDGSREVQILNIGKDEKDIKAPSDVGKEGVITATRNDEETVLEKEEKPIMNGIKTKDRPGVLTGKTYKIKTGYGNLYITVNDDENCRPFEVFASIGKNGGVMQEQTEGMCRMISTALRAGVSVSEIIDQLKGIRGPMPTFTERGTVYSLPDAIGRVLEWHIEAVEENKKRKEKHLEGTGTSTTLEKDAQPILIATQESLTPEGVSIANLGHSPECPDCGDLMQMAEGCMSCRACGYSRCD